MSCLTHCRVPSGNGAHCGACHRSFGVVSTFDAHRTGDAGHRHCTDPATIGMHQDRFGYWRRAASARRTTPRPPGGEPP